MLQAVDLVMSERLLEVEVVNSSDQKQRVYVPYVTRQPLYVDSLNLFIVMIS